MSRKRPNLTIVGEAPEMPATGSDTEPEGEDTLEAVSAHLADLGGRAATLAQEKGMTAAERLMIVDGWALDTMGMLGYLITTLQAEYVSLARTVAQIVGDDERYGLPDVDVEVEAKALMLQMAAARIQAEIDYLEGKPPPPSGLIVP